MYIYIYTYVIITWRIIYTIRVSTVFRTLPVVNCRLPRTVLNILVIHPPKSHWSCSGSSFSPAKWCFSDSPSGMQQLSQVWGHHSTKTSSWHRHVPWHRWFTRTEGWYLDMNQRLSKMQSFWHIPLRNNPVVILSLLTATSSKQSPGTPTLRSQVQCLPQCLRKSWTLEHSSQNPWKHCTEVTSEFCHPEAG